MNSGWSCLSDAPSDSPRVSCQDQENWLPPALFWSPCEMQYQTEPLPRPLAFSGCTSQSLEDFCALPVEEEFSGTRILFNHIQGSSKSSYDMLIMKNLCGNFKVLLHQNKLISYSLFPLIFQFHHRDISQSPLLNTCSDCYGVGLQT